MSNAVDFAQQLIAIPSESGHEGQIVQWIEQFLTGLSLQSQRIQSNIICKLAGTNTTKALIFNGHVDTVSAGDLAAWRNAPCKPTIKDGKLYGLGASDMKSGVAIMLALAQQFSTQKPPIDLWFHFVVQEETTGQGTNDVMTDFAAKYQKKYAQVAGILLEPTNLDLINVAHKGNIFLKVIAHGDGGHGAYVDMVKVKAVDELWKAKEKLEALVASWTSTYADELLGPPTIALTCITAGNSETPNKIADTCEATFDLRTTPKLHPKALEVIKQTLGNAVEVQTVYDPLPHGYTSKDEHIVQLAQAITGCPLGITPASTDMLFFTALSIPAIIVGPGDKSVEHKPNEYVELAKVDTMLEYAQQIIAQF